MREFFIMKEDEVSNKLSILAQYKINNENSRI